MKLLIVIVAAVLLQVTFAVNYYNAAYRADNNKYLIRIPSGTLINFVAAAQQYKSSATTFRRENLANGKSRFWDASVGSFLCQTSRGSDFYIEAVHGRNDATCQFLVTNSGTGWVLIKADNGKYVCRVRDGDTEFIMASGESAGQNCNFFEEVE